MQMMINTFFLLLTCTSARFRFPLFSQPKSCQTRPVDKSRTKPAACTPISRPNHRLPPAALIESHRKRRGHRPSSSTLWHRPQSRRKWRRRHLSHSHEKQPISCTPQIVQNDREIYETADTEFCIPDVRSSSAGHSTSVHSNSRLMQLKWRL